MGHSSFTITLERYAGIALYERESACSSEAGVTGLEPATYGFGDRRSTS